MLRAKSAGMGAFQFRETSSLGGLPPYSLLIPKEHYLAFQPTLKRVIQVGTVVMASRASIGSPCSLEPRKSLSKVF